MRHSRTRGCPHYPSFRDIVGGLPVKLTIRQGRITQTSAWFDLLLEGEAEEIKEASEIIRAFFRPFELHLREGRGLLGRSDSPSEPSLLPGIRISS